MKGEVVQRVILEVVADLPVNHDPYTFASEVNIAVAGINPAQVSEVEVKLVDAYREEI